MKASLKICAVLTVILSLVFSLCCMAEDPGDTEPEISAENGWVYMEEDPDEGAEFAPAPMDANDIDNECY